MSDVCHMCNGAIAVTSAGVCSRCADTHPLAPREKPQPIMTQLLTDAQSRIAELEAVYKTSQQYREALEHSLRKAEVDRNEAVAEAKQLRGDYNEQVRVNAELAGEVERLLNLLRSAVHFVNLSHHDASSEALWIQSGELQKKIYEALTAAADTPPTETTAPGSADDSD